MRPAIIASNLITKSLHISFLFSPYYLIMHVNHFVCTFYVPNILLSEHCNFSIRLASQKFMLSIDIPPLFAVEHAVSKTVTMPTITLLCMHEV